MTDLPPESGDLQALKAETDAALAAAADLRAWDAVRIGVLGRNGTLTGLLRDLGTHLTDQVSVALAPKRAQLDPALAQALPIVKETDHDLLFVELRPDEQGGFALKATPYHRPFRPNGQPQALEMFAFRASDQAVLARGGSAAGEAPNLALGADMLTSPFSIVIVDEQGKTYYRADYSVDMNTLRRRASTALAAA